MILFYFMMYFLNVYWFSKIFRGLVKALSKPKKAKQS